MRNSPWNWILGLGVIFSLVSCSQTKKAGNATGGSDIFASPKGNTSGEVGDYDLSGLPNLGPTEQKALETVNEELSQTVPASGLPDFSPAVDQMLNDIEKAEKAGQDTTQMRYALMGKMLTECANQVSPYTPQPGETYLGRFALMCTGSAIVATLDQKGQYSSYDSAGIPLGKPNISYKGKYVGVIDDVTVTGTGTGTVTANSSGAGQSTGNWIAYASDGSTGQFQLSCELTDSPQAATQTCTPSVYIEYCPSANGKLVTSQNPIPQKYEEGMKKLAACYRQAITLASPILWDYMNSLPPSTQQALQAALFMQ